MYWLKGCGMQGSGVEDLPAVRLIKAGFLGAPEQFAVWFRSYTGRFYHRDAAQRPWGAVALGLRDVFYSTTRDLGSSAPSSRSGQ